MHTAGGEAAEELFQPTARLRTTKPGGSITRSMNNIASPESWL
jgi:hypothetical protein